MKYIFSFILILFTSLVTFSQTKTEIEWKTWSQLEVALAKKQKPVLIFFHAKWCVYCKKIEREVFTKPKVINKINSKYYALEMDVESLDTIVFDGLTFTNKQAKTKRNGVHELPLLLASKKGKVFRLPATLIFNKDFTVKEKIYTYYTSNQLLKLLQ